MKILGKVIRGIAITAMIFLTGYALLGLALLALRPFILQVI